MSRAEQRALSLPPHPHVNALLSVAFVREAVPSPTFKTAGLAQVLSPAYGRASIPDDTLADHVSSSSTEARLPACPAVCAGRTGRPSGGCSRRARASAPHWLCPRLTMFALLLRPRNIFSYLLTFAVICWCALTSASIFEQALRMEHQKWLVAYPLFLCYSAFALITIF